MEFKEYKNCPFPVKDKGTKNDMIYSRNGVIYINKTLCEKEGFDVDDMYDLLIVKMSKA